jgi:hypothetical protein
MMFTLPITIDDQGEVCIQLFNYVFRTTQNNSGMCRNKGEAVYIQIIAFITSYMDNA